MPRPAAVLNLKVSASARTVIQEWVAASDLTDPVPGLLFGGPPGAAHSWSIGMYERSQIPDLEKLPAVDGQAAHFNVDGIELIFWQHFLREKIEGKTLDYDEHRRFFVY